MEPSVLLSQKPVFSILRSSSSTSLSWPSSSVFSIFSTRFGSHHTSLKNGALRTRRSLWLLRNQIWMLPPLMPLLSTLQPPTIPTGFPHTISKSLRLVRSRVHDPSLALSAPLTKFITATFNLIAVIDMQCSYWCPGYTVPNPLACPIIADNTILCARLGVKLFSKNVLYKQKLRWIPCVGSNQIEHFIRSE